MCTAASVMDSAATYMLYICMYVCSVPYIVFIVCYIVTYVRTVLLLCTNGSPSVQDCEDQSRYELCITAANVAGEPPMAANATIVITCTDINDNPPMFNSTRCEALLNETSPIQETVVTTLSAYDNDQPGVR